MPTPLPPGVYVEETSFRTQTIEGVGTSTCAFVGPTHTGPAALPLPALTNFAEFAALYGGLQDLVFDGAAEPTRHHLAHAARAYFDNGGRRLVVARTTVPGAQPGAQRAPDASAYAAALQTLETLDDLATVAAPGHSACYVPDQPGLYEDIRQALLAHVSAPRRHRVAVLDAPPDISLAQLQRLRAEVDCPHAALYHPWVVVANPLFDPLANPSSPEPAELVLPPSGFVCGIYARNDMARGVHKAPANEVVAGALRFSAAISQGEQEVLNPLGVNCLRRFSGRGNRVWGARTLSNDPEWKYLNVRRCVDYLEASIERGLQWAVFEPNAEPLWARVQAVVSDFLGNSWRNGALLGRKPQEAYFVRCDRSTMTQTDLDQGRLVCEIGVAMLKPAEFLILRIALPTASPP